MDFVQLKSESLHAPVQHNRVSDRFLVNEEYLWEVVGRFVMEKNH